MKIQTSILSLMLSAAFLQGCAEAKYNPRTANPAAQSTSTNPPTDSQSAPSGETKPAEGAPVLPQENAQNSDSSGRDDRGQSTQNVPPASDEGSGQNPAKSSPTKSASANGSGKSTDSGPDKWIPDHSGRPGSSRSHEGRSHEGSSRDGDSDQWSPSEIGSVGSKDKSKSGEVDVWSPAGKGNSANEEREIVIHHGHDQQDGRDRSDDCVPVNSAPTDSRKGGTVHDGQGAKAVDLLFIVDTSKSFDSERAQIAASLHGFIQKFAGRDLHVGILLAHSPGSEVMVKGEPLADYGGPSFRWNGERINVSPQQSFLRYNKWDSEVLTSHALSSDEIENRLRKKLLVIADVDGYSREHNDTYRERVTSTTGQAGLVSLYSAITVPKNISTLSLKQNARFFRSNASLAVVFIASRADLNAENAGLGISQVRSALHELKGSQPLVLAGILPAAQETNYSRLIRGEQGMVQGLGSPYQGKLEKLAAFILDRI